MASRLRDLDHDSRRHTNALLRAYMHAVIDKVIERAGDRDWKDRPI